MLELLDYAWTVAVVAGSAGVIWEIIVEACR